MDRPKGRGLKKNTPQFPADLYALGSKPGDTSKQRPTVSSSVKESTKLTKREELKTDTKLTSSSNRTVDKKRENTSSTVSDVPAKKPKHSTGRSSASSSEASSPSTVSDTWESLALDFDPEYFTIIMKEALDKDDNDKIIGYICGAIKMLKLQKGKVDIVLIESIAYILVRKPNLFQNEMVTNGFCSILRRDCASYLKTRSSIYIVHFAVNCLMYIYANSKRWPESILKVFLEDSAGDRIWVDHELTKSLVSNIIHSLHTKSIPSHMRDTLTRNIIQTSVPGAPPPAETPEEEILPTEAAQTIEAMKEPVLMSRFKSSHREVMENLVIETVKDHLQRKQSPDMISKNFLKMLTSLCGLVEVRFMLSSKIESWLQNTKLMRNAQELLISLCINCHGKNVKDVEVIAALIKIRLKTKALSNYFLTCIKEMVSIHEESLSVVLKHTIYNELSNSHNPNNMPILTVTFQADPDRSAKFLAKILLDLLLTREDCLRPLRGLLREMVRVLKAELHLPVFVEELLNRTDPLGKEIDATRAFMSVADIIMLTMFLVVMPHARSDKKDPQQIEKMQTWISHIQSEAVWWLHSKVIPIYKPSSPDFIQVLHKVLLLEVGEQYYKIDNWPPEQDRSLFIRLATEVPMMEATLITIMVMGVSKDHPITPSDALDLVDQLVKRASAIQDPLIQTLQVNKVKVYDLIFNLCAYRHPDAIELPPGYTPPHLAISNLYWKVWGILLILCAHNPQILGSPAWDKYPTLRSLMEMCITGSFIFPPGYEDLQMLAGEKQAILEFESHLAAASTKIEITEATSLLVPQLMSLCPSGPGRRPPPPVLENIKAMNMSLRLGHLLCRSRNPDFLLDIIQRQGPSQSMPWLADLVHNSEGAFNHLPVQCLCEFLLISSSNVEGKYQQLLAHLQQIVTSPDQEPEAACEVLDYFLRRLSSTANRSLAISGLKIVLSALVDTDIMEVDENFEEKQDDSAWLLKNLPKIPHFQYARHQIIAALRSACQVENDPYLITAYLRFLAQYAIGDLHEMNDLVLDMAQLLVERSTIMGAILPSNDKPNKALDSFLIIYATYMNKARSTRRDNYSWPDTTEHVLVTWPTGDRCIIYLLVIHAIVILLTYGTENITRITEYHYLLGIWFPIDASNMPKGYIMETSEEAVLIPDWLKLYMIRSHVPHLVDVASTGLDLNQLMLFIQSFGIPIQSMKKLLSALDDSVLEGPEVFRDITVDKSYMQQLVEVQNRRGAKGGERFLAALDLTPTGETEKIFMDVDDSDISLSNDVVMKPRLKQEYLTIEEGMASVEKLFNLRSDPVTIKGLRQLFLSLQRTVVHSTCCSNEKNNFVNEFLKFFARKVNGKDEPFIRGIISKLQFSCPLFRFFASHCSSGINLINFTIVAKAVLSLAKDLPRAKPLVSILSDYILSKDKDFEESYLKDKLENSSMESTLQRTLGKLFNVPSSKCGTYIDYLVRLEPEILNSSIESQMRLLFASNETFTLQCRPYFLTLLTHQASWKTLDNCMDRLLKSDVVSMYDATAVLDFIQAITCNPKLWQGREKRTPKHFICEDILNLSTCQLKCICDYIVKETLILKDEDKSSFVNRNKLNNRLDLVTRSVKPCESAIVTSLGKYLLMKISSQSSQVRLVWIEFTVQLYLKMPCLISHLRNLDVDKILSEFSIFSVGGTSVADGMSHILLTALSSSQQSKEWQDMSNDLELAMRKMAATHPLIVLRQLPLIASCLRGRVDLDWPIFRMRNHLLLFQQIAGLLELLEPYIFHKQYRQSLHKTLDTYLDLFMHYGHDGSFNLVTNLVSQFVNFIHNYMKQSIHAAYDYLLTKASIISELQTEFQMLNTICIVIPKDRDEGFEIILTPGTNLEPPASQLDSKIQQLNAEGESSGSLTFLEYITSKRPALLAPALDKLCFLLTSTSGTVRSFAHTLVLRYLRHSPRSANVVLPAYLTCLNHSHPDVVSSALDSIPEVIVSSQELAVPILQKIFILGTRQNINTGPCISKIISLLNLQSGC